MISKVPEGIEQVEIEGKGMGIRATKKFDKHEFICEYRGELISNHEAQCREESSDHNGCYMYFFEYKSKKLWYVLKWKLPL
jgi:SET domain-containing protein